MPFPVTTQQGQGSRAIFTEPPAFSTDTHHHTSRCRRHVIVVLSLLPGLLSGTNTIVSRNWTWWTNLQEHRLPSRQFNSQPSQSNDLQKWYIYINWLSGDIGLPPSTAPHSTAPDMLHPSNFEHQARYPQVYISLSQGSNPTNYQNCLLVPIVE